MMEHKIGEKFAMSINGREVMLEVVPHCGCYGCYFKGDNDCKVEEIRLGREVEYCDRACRKDKTSVIFKQVIPTIEDVKNSMVANAVSNVDFAYIVAHRTNDGEVKINTIGKPENIGQLKKQLLKILEEEK